jgi:hypothetical protein
MGRRSRYRRKRKSGLPIWELSVLAVILVYLSGTYAKQFALIVFTLGAAGFVIFFALPWLLKEIFAAQKFQDLRYPIDTRRIPADEREGKSRDEEDGSDVFDWRTPAPESRPDSWSIDLLKALEWKRFEEVARKLYELQGYKARTTNIGADGGVDVIVYQPDTNDPMSLVQCKAWNTRPVGEKPLRELLGVLTHHGIKHGVFMTTSTFNDKARKFAASNNITLVDGTELLHEIMELGREKRESLLEFATSGDYRTPTCPRCDTKMVKRKGGTFWGCRNYPRCRQTFHISTA